MNAIDKVLAIAAEEVGYLEKKSNSNLDSKTANAGSNNFTKYARDLYPSLQGQAWCDMYVDWCMMKAFGKEKAKALVGGWSAYTPTSAQYYKNKGQYHKTGIRGDQIFFKNSTRICHTGLVKTVENGRVYTFEGNTSAGPKVIPNGGAVCEKSYPINHPSIDGYGRPDYASIDTPNYTVGWNSDENGWWYADSETTYYKNCWVKINHARYYFNNDGYALKGWQLIDGKWYYFEPTIGHPKECALYVSNEDGVQTVGYFE